MSCPTHHSSFGWLVLFLFFLPVYCFSASPVSVSNPMIFAREPLTLPPEYGRVIYRKNSTAADQIYIIGQAHRSALSGKNGEKTVQTQLEIFRIGEWLVKSRDVEILLPEGFFSRHRETDAVKREVAAKRTDLPSPDDASLRERLLETATFVSADTLLNSNYNLHLGQVEDEGLYREVREFLDRIGANKGDVDPNVYDRLDRFQKQRTAVMLQNIPSVTESAFQQGTSQSKSAILTIGMAHVPEILQFLQKEKIDLFSEESEVSASLKLLERNYGVTVILPKTLAEDEKVLRITRMYDLNQEH